MNENTHDVQEEPYPCNIRYKHIRFNDGYSLTLCIQLKKTGHIKEPIRYNTTLSKYEYIPTGEFYLNNENNVKYSRHIHSNNEILTKVNVGWAICVPSDNYKRKEGNLLARSRLLHDVHCYLTTDEKVTSKYVLLRALLLLFHSNWDFPFLHSNSMKKYIDYLISEINR